MYSRRPFDFPGLLLQTPQTEDPHATLLPAFLSAPVRGCISGRYLSRFATEPMLAAASRRKPHAADAVMIDSNENPLGPSQSARDAMAAIIPQGGRYSDNLTDELVQTLAQMEGLNPEFVTATVGSTPPLALSVIAFCNRAKKLCDGRSRIRTRHDGRRKQWRARGQGPAYKNARP